MAVISQIRSRSGLLITVIGVAMALFVAGDLLNSGQSLFVQQNTDIAVIGNEKISYQEFETRVQNQIGDQSVDQNAREQVRQRVWSQLVQEKTFGKEFDELGIRVSPDELFNQIKETQPNSILYQYFTNPQTGQIFEQFRDPATGGLNTTTVLAYANQLISQDQTENWLPIEKAVKQDRIQTKYNKMIEKGLYFNTNQVKNDQNEKNTFLRVSYVSQLFRDLPDDQVEVSDSDLKNYYNNHKSELQFQQPEATRSIDYVEFVKEPSASDIEAIKEEMADLKVPFAASVNDTLFVLRNSDDQTTGIGYFSQGELPAEYDSLALNDTIGSVYGPVVEGDFFLIAKKMGEKVAPDSVEARHILLPIVENDTATARSRADSLKSVIKRQKNFADLASEFSEDLGSAQKGGDLGYFTEGTMVKPFNDACFDGEVGDMPIVVSQFGVHLIEITDQTADKKKVLMATVKREIVASKNTADKIYNEASAFSITNDTREKFVAATEGIGVKTANFIKEGDNKVNDLESPRELVRWMYANEMGAISEPFELGKKFVVAMVTEIRPEGTLPFDIVAEQVKSEVIKEKKGEVLAAKMQGASDLNTLASTLGSRVQNIPELQFSSFSVPGLGPEFQLMGEAFGIPLGNVSKPIVGNQGVYVIQVEQTSDKATNTDDEQTRDELARAIQGRLNYQVSEALKESANIEDMRSKFY